MVRFVFGLRQESGLVTAETMTKLFNIVRVWEHAPDLGYNFVLEFGHLALPHIEPMGLEFMVSSTPLTDEKEQTLTDGRCCPLA